MNPGPRGRPWPAMLGLAGTSVLPTLAFCLSGCTSLPTLVRDSAGTIGTPAAFFERLVAAGVQVLEFNPLNPKNVRAQWELNQRDHRKLLVVDGRTAFLGGINISSVYSGGSFGGSPRHRAPGSLAWRDTDLQLQGPVVAELQKLFLATWAAQAGPALPALDWVPKGPAAGRQVVRAIGSSPDDRFSLINATLLSAIAAAETRVQVTNACFAPDPQWLAALEAAAARGVKIHERRGVILHSKTALIDGVWSTVSSTNLDWRSFLHNHELNAVVLGAEFGDPLAAMFARDLAAPDPVLLESWLQRPWATQVKEWLARTWEYWL